MVGLHRKVQKFCHEVYDPIWCHGSTIQHLTTVDGQCANLALPRGLAWSTCYDLYDFICMALHDLHCTAVALRNCSLTQSSLSFELCASALTFLKAVWVDQDLIHGVLSSNSRSSEVVINGTSCRMWKITIHDGRKRMFPL